jgi:hypothetical protein
MIDPTLQSKYASCASRTRSEEDVAGNEARGSSTYGEESEGNASHEFECRDRSGRHGICLWSSVPGDMKLVKTQSRWAGWRRQLGGVDVGVGDNW